MRVSRALRSFAIAACILGYAAAVTTLGWAYYKTWAKHEVPPGKAAKVITNQIIKANYGPEYWKNIKTIEEAYAGKNLLTPIPYYYALLQRDRNLCDELGYIRHSAYLKPYKELTRKEKLLLARRIPIIGGKPHYYPSSQMDFDLVDVLISASKAGPAAEDASLDKKREVAATWYAYDNYHFYFSLTQDEIDETVKELSAGLASPISGNAINPFEKEFSPGNAYCKRVTEKGELEKLYERDSYLRRYFLPSQFKSREYLYYRIYGEKSVIAEGMCLVRPEEDD